MVVPVAPVKLEIDSYYVTPVELHSLFLHDLRQARCYDVSSPIELVVVVVIPLRSSLSLPYYPTGSLQVYYS